MLETIAQRPTNFSSYTSEQNAKVIFGAIPTFEFLIQRFRIPGLNVPSIQMQGRTGNFSRPGEKIEFDKPWTLEIILDEHYIAYKELFKWINSYAGIEDDVERDFQKIVSDASVVVFDNNRNEILNFNFYNVFPLGISEIAFDTTASGHTYLKFNASFDYTHFEPVDNVKPICPV